MDTCSALSAGRCWFAVQHSFFDQTGECMGSHRDPQQPCPFLSPCAKVVAVSPVCPLDFLRGQERLPKIRPGVASPAYIILSQNGLGWERSSKPIQLQLLPWAVLPATNLVAHGPIQPGLLGLYSQWPRAGDGPTMRQGGNVTWRNQMGEPAPALTHHCSLDRPLAAQRGTSPSQLSISTPRRC